uniref:Uncharacterized protein n=1 Tax=Acrobeloides nanus TaxID=290746 RepID=A0A914DF14_9BILA
MSIFYVFPTILQMLAYYFQIKRVSSTANTFIQIGAEFNGMVNALIYLLKHQEFRESSKRLYIVVVEKFQHGKAIILL